MGRNNSENGDGSRNGGYYSGEGAYRNGNNNGGLIVGAPNKGGN